MTALALAVISATMVLAPTLSFAQQTMEAKTKPPTEPKDKKCSTKIQVKATGVTNGTEYTATILDKSIIKTAADKETLSFTFNFNKAQKSSIIQEMKPAPSIPGICPAAGSELQGDVNGKTFDVTIGDVKKPTRVSVDVSDISVEPPIDPTEPPVVNATL